MIEALGARTSCELNKKKAAADTRRLVKSLTVKVFHRYYIIQLLVPTNSKWPGLE